MFKRIFRMLSVFLPRITMSGLMGAVDLEADDICQCAVDAD